MAITPPPPQPPNHHHFQPPISIPINMSTLTHSELHSLSLLTSPPSPQTIFDDDDDKFVESSQFFINPSLSTHQQTYSTSPHHHHHHPHHHRRLRHHDRIETNLIISSLKKHLNFTNNSSTNSAKENVVDIFNKHGVVVDLAALEEKDRHGGLFIDELRKMADGKFSEEELLRVLEGMKGEWCSRRKKTRVVDASVLGDALPLGWKLIVALRRKGGRFSPYCRRYISPTGDRFSSCKEVSSYLQPYFGINDAKLVRDSRVEFQQLQTVNSVNHKHVNSEHGNLMLNRCNSTIRNTCAPMELEKEASILGIDNLPDVQVCDLYECHSCNLSFDAKDKYLQHMFSLHQETTKRYSLDTSVGDKVIIKDGKAEHPKRKRKRKHGSSVADGVIMKNGKYGCQFCDKVFEERRRYLGHVGNHVKGSIETPQDLLAQLHGSGKALCVDKSPTVISNSKMDALIEIAQSSVQDNIPPVFEKAPSSVNEVDRCNALNATGTSLVMDGDQNTKENSGSCLTEVDMEKNCREGNKTTKGGFEEGKVSSQGLHSPCNRGDKVNGLSMTHAVNCLYPLVGELDGKDIKDKSYTSELNLLNNIGEIPRTNKIIKVPTSCPNECRHGNDVKKGKTLSAKVNSPAKKCKSSPSGLNPQGQAEIPKTDIDNSAATSCPVECELDKTVAKDKTSSTKLNALPKMSKTSSSELNYQGEARKILMTDEKINVATSCPNEEIIKDVKDGKTFSTELDPLAKMSRVFNTDEEINGQYFISNIDDFGEDSCSETSVTPVAENGIADNVVGNGNCKSTVSEDEKSADKPVGVNNIHYVWCREKTSDPISSGEKIQLEPIHESEPVTFSCKNHASSCAVPQSSLNSTSTFDEIFDKAGEDICSLDQNLHSVSGVEYMKLDVIEPQMYKYDAMNQEDSISFYEVSMDLENNIGLGLELDNSPRCRSEFPQKTTGKCLGMTVDQDVIQDEVSMDLENNIGLGLELDNSPRCQSEFPKKMAGKCLGMTVNQDEVSTDLENKFGLGLELDNSPRCQSEFPQEMAGKCLSTTVCVWCGVEFSHEIGHVEPQPDSVGFMCPACRAKISKQFNELENNFSLSSQC